MEVSEASDDAVPATAPVDAGRAGRGAVRHFFCGLAMGSADIVPGVSGGTVALILGIYSRLVAAISHVDGSLAAHLLRRRWRDALAHVDAAFLVALGAGIGTGILGLASVMNRLLTSDGSRPYTLAAFFGLILASTVLVLRMAAEARGAGTRRTFESGTALAVAVVLGAAVAFWITGLQGGLAEDPSLPYTFLCGAVAICAMILPGISGAFLLLLLGMYVPVTGILRRLPSMDVTTRDLATLGVFALGCILGLLSFSRLLRWLLARHLAVTLAVLAGFMAGSLRKIWPFQRDVTLSHLDAAGLTAQEIADLEAHPGHVAALELKHRILVNEIPHLSGRVLAIAAVAVGAALLVLAVDRIARRRARPT